MLCSVNTKIRPPATLPKLTLRLDFSQRKPFRKWKWMHHSQSLVWIVLMGCHDKYWQLAEGSSVHCETPNARAADATTSSACACGGGGRSGKAEASWRAGRLVTSWPRGLLQGHQPESRPGCLRRCKGRASGVRPCNGPGFCISERRGAAETSGGSRVTADVSTRLGSPGRRG